MIPADLVNPFHTHKADDTLKVPAGDIPRLHHAALSTCEQALQQARHARASVGVLLMGEAGGGKSHLLAQLREKVTRDRSTVLATIRMGKAYAGRLWRHLREKLVEELLRQYPPSTDGGNGLLRILRNTFPQWAAAVEGTSGGLLQWLVGRSKHADLAPHLDGFARTWSLDYNLLRVLPAIGTPDLTTPANSWLQGRLLGTKDLERLGLPPVFPSEQEQEVQAQDVVLSFLRLAGEQTTLLLCFDEVEAIQAGAYDATALRQFTTLVTALLAEAGPRVVVTSIRPTVLLDVQKAVEFANVKKIGQLEARIAMLTRDEASQLTIARLDAEPTCRAARRQRPDDRFWPLGERGVRAAFDQNPRGMTPRHLILACQIEFERLQKGGRVQPSAITPPPAIRLPGEEPTPASCSSAVLPRPGDGSDRAKEFFRLWDRIRRKNLERLAALSFDSVLAIGLPWLVQVTEAAWLQVLDTMLGLADVNLVFQPTSRGRKPLGISLCHQSPQVLWHRLERLKKQWSAARGTTLSTLVLLRPEFERTTKHAADRLVALQQVGVRVLALDRHLLAELAAYQRLLTAALEGDMTRCGKPVPVAEYDSWVKEHLSEPVKEFLRHVFQAEPPAAPARVAESRPKATARRK